MTKMQGRAAVLLLAVITLNTCELSPESKAMLDGPATPGGALFAVILAVCVCLVLYAVTNGGD